jgi:serine/threonine protein kinase
MLLTPNTLLQQRYRIVHLLARGGMGAVYQATDQRLGNTVALKQTLMTDASLQAAFAREARLLAGLHHPVLPAVTDHFIEEMGQFLVMEFVPGDDLKTLLERNADPFPLIAVLDWADALLDALDFLHTQPQPIIHRDIKPQNLKLTPRGDVVLLDFGLAKAALLQGTDPAANQSIFGYTLQYAPLEQIQGTGTDARSDLYSLAATIYHLLTAVLPPDALTRVSTLIEGHPDPLRLAHDLNPNIPDTIAAVLHQALAVNPVERPASAALMRIAIQNARTRGSIPAFAPGGSSSGRSTLTMPVVAQPQAAAQPLPPSPATVPRPASNPVSTTEDPQTQHPATGRRAPQRLKGMVGLVLLLAIVVGTWGYFAFSSEQAKETPRTTASENVITTGQSRSDPVPYKEVMALPGWEVQVLETVRGDAAWTRLYDANAFNDPAPEGMEYLLVKVRARATFAGNDARQLYFVVTGDGLREYTRSGVPPEPGLETELVSGSASEGWIAFPIGKHEGSLLLKMKELQGSGDDTTRFLALEKGAALSISPDLEQIRAEPLGQTREAPAPYGEQVTTEDWQLTIRDVIWGDAAWELVEATNQFSDPPAAGMQYVAVQMHIRSISTQDKARQIYSYGFALLDNDGIIYTAPSVVDPHPAIDLNLYPGGEHTGWFVLQAPRQIQAATLRYEPTFGNRELNTRYLALQPELQLPTTPSRQALSTHYSVFLTQTASPLPFN